MSSQNNNGCGLLIGVLFAGSLFSAMVSSCTSNNNIGATYTSTPDQSSFEHRYATERVKMEGYSDQEAKQAADAIVKFLDAQERRKR